MTSLRCLCLKLAFPSSNEINKGYLRYLKVSRRINHIFENPIHSKLNLFFLPTCECTKEPNCERLCLKEYYVFDFETDKIMYELEKSFDCDALNEAIPGKYRLIAELCAGIRPPNTEDILYDMICIKPECVNEVVEERKFKPDTVQDILSQRLSYSSENRNICHIPFLTDCTTPTRFGCDSVLDGVNLGCVDIVDHVDDLTLSECLFCLEHLEFNHLPILIFQIVQNLHAAEEKNLNSVTTDDYFEAVDLLDDVLTRIIELVGEDCNEEFYFRRAFKRVDYQPQLLLEDLDKVIEMNPKHIPSMRLKSEILFNRGETEKCEELLTKALFLIEEEYVNNEEIVAEESQKVVVDNFIFLDLFSTIRELGVMKTDTKKISSNVSEFSLSLLDQIISSKIPSNHTELILQRAFSYIKNPYTTRQEEFDEGEFEEQVKLMMKLTEEVLKIDPRNIKAQTHMSLGYMRLENYESAIPHQNILIEMLDGDNDDIIPISQVVNQLKLTQLHTTYENRGIAKWSIYDYEGAMQDFKRCIEVMEKYGLVNEEMMERVKSRIDLLEDNT